MNTENVSMDNDLFYEPEQGFWDGADQLSFEASNLEQEWPQPTNVFIQKMAATDRLTTGLQNLAFADFKQVVGALIDADPHATYRFLIVPLHRTGETLSFTLMSKTTGGEPPIKADNACSLHLAIEWMAARASHFEVSFSAGGTYWVHKQ